MHTFSKSSLLNIVNGLGVVFVTSICFMQTALSAEKNNAVSGKSSKQDAFLQNLAAVGVTYEQKGDKLDIIIDEKKAVNAMPALEKAGVIPKIPVADIKRAPLGMSVAVVGVSFTVVIVDALYGSDPKLDKLHVQAYVEPLDSKDKQACYSFDYNNAMHKKMNLNTVTPKDFMMNTPGFTFSEWCRLHINSETK